MDEQYIVKPQRWGRPSNYGEKGGLLRVITFFSIFKRFIYLERGRKREGTQAGGIERERKRDTHADSTLSTEAETGLSHYPKFMT